MGAATEDWTQAVQAIDETESAALSDLCQIIAEEQSASCSTDNYASNAATGFVHMIARRKSWERPRPGMTVCGQDYITRGYAKHVIMPGHLRQCLKCAKAHEWTLLDLAAYDSD